MHCTAARPSLQKRERHPGIVLCTAVCLILSMPFSYGQEMAVPVEVHVPLLLNALTFDYAFMTRNPDEIVLGILYQSTNQLSRKVKDEVVSMIRRDRRRIVEEHPVRAIPIEYSATADYARRIAAQGIHALYVAPIPGADISQIAHATRKENIVTVTGVPAYVERGLSIGVRTRDGQHAFIINITASAAEGASLDARILALARIVR